MKKLIPLFILFSLLLTACGGSEEMAPATYDITGTWEYTMSELDHQDTIYDTGTITFVGDLGAGEYSLINFYEIEYTGTYIVSKIQFLFTGQDGSLIQGSFTDPTHLIGGWETEETGGLWTAVKQVDE